MSSSSLAERAVALTTEVDRVLQSGDPGTVDEETVVSLLVAAVQLYAARAERVERIARIPAGALPATAAMVAASVLLKAVNVAPFELGLWQSWSQ